MQEKKRALSLEHEEGNTPFMLTATPHRGPFQLTYTPQLPSPLALPLEGLVVEMTQRLEALFQIEPALLSVY